MKKWPSLSTYVTSPVFNHPSDVSVSRVVPDLRQYPFMTFGPRTHTSPLSPRLTSFPSSSTILASTLALSSPTENDPENSWGRHPTAEQVISVIPQACFTLICPGGHSFSSSAQTSLPRGAAPHDTCSTELKSYCLDLESFAMATTIGGTSIKDVIRNRCMFSNIFTKSNFGMT